MNLIVPFKRHLLIIIAISAGLTASWVAAQTSETDGTTIQTRYSSETLVRQERKKICPLPTTYADKKSPEQQEHKVDVCHNGKTINIAKSAAPAHQKHGDTMGPCPTSRGK